MNYWDTQGIPFRPAVRVKPLARLWDADYRTWFVRVRVTSRFSGECGRIRCVRASELFQRQGVLRGKCGKLYWQGRMPDAELLALPEVSK